MGIFCSCLVVKCDFRVVNCSDIVNWICVLMVSFRLGRSVNVGCIF